MTVGERIKQIREEKGISQEDLAKLLGLKDKSSVCKIEKAGDNISTKSIVKYAKALQISPADLMGWESTSEEKNSKNPLTIEITSSKVINDQLMIRALKFIQKFDKASPEIQKGIESLLGLNRSDP